MAGMSDCDQWVAPGGEGRNMRRGVVDERSE